MKAFAFIGPHSTGKSTLIGQLRVRPEFQPIHVIDGIPRRLILAGFPMGELARPRSFAEYAQAQALALGRVPAGTDWLFSDRTTFDAFCYATLNERLNPGSVGPEALAFLLATALLERAHFDQYFFFPCYSTPLVSDGVRSTDLEYRAELEATFRENLTRLQLPHCVMPDGNQDRMRLVEDHR